MGSGYRFASANFRVTGAANRRDFSKIPTKIRPPFGKNALPARSNRGFGEHLDSYVTARILLTALTSLLQWQTAPGTAERPREGHAAVPGGSGIDCRLNNCSRFAHDPKNFFKSERDLTTKNIGPRHLLVVIAPVAEVLLGRDEPEGSGSMGRVVHPA